MKYCYIVSLAIILFVSCSNGISSSNPSDNDITYSIGSTGPGGGIVFYDKKVYSNGWRYIEVTNFDVSTAAPWGGYEYSISGLSTDIGYATSNTTKIVSTLGSTSTAASVCDNLVSGGYSDWALPTKDELSLIFYNIKATGVAIIASERYWASNEQSAYHACVHRFDTGEPGGYRKDLNVRVRAIRYF